MPDDIQQMQVTKSRTDWWADLGTKVGVPTTLLGMVLYFGGPYAKEIFDVYKDTVKEVKATQIELKENLQKQTEFSEKQVEVSELNAEAHAKLVENHKAITDVLKTSNEQLEKASTQLQLQTDMLKEIDRNTRKPQ